MAEKKSKNIFLFYIIGSIAVMSVAILSVVFGSADIAFDDVMAALFNFDSTNVTHQIIVDLRIPRTLGSMLVGASFAVSGAIMQGMTRNPLADSGILGINYGASFALSLCLALFASMNYALVVLFSLLGASFAALIVYGVTGFNHGKQSPVRLVLAGTGVGVFLSALSQAIAMYYNIGQDIVFWTAGGVARIRMDQLLYVAPIIFIALIGAVLLSHSVSLLSIGEDSARGLGLNISRTKTLCMLVVLALAGSAVALAGPVSFIGLIVPHVVRSIIGVDYRKIIPCSILAGSLFALCADLISRIINPPHEIPIGIILAVVGVPFFLYLSRRKRRDSYV